MNSIRIYTFILLLFSLAIIIACNQQNNFKKNISTHDEDESHYSGENCMRCHYTVDRESDGSFSLAGTVNYPTDEKRTIKAYNNIGTLVASVEVDKLNNFYTTEMIDFSQGITIEIHNENNEVLDTMFNTIYTGECNLCHDGSYQNQIGQF